MMAFQEHNLKDKVKVVVNRAGLDSGQISLKKAQDTIGREIFWQLPNDYRTMVEVRNNGVPLIEQAPRAAITQSILQMALALGEAEKAPEDGDPAKASAKKGAAWLPSIFGQKK
jgi:pilus assembly protein CpaE